jgi:hypothetical protein
VRLGLAAPISGGIFARLDGYVRMSEIKVVGNVVTRGRPSRAIGQVRGPERNAGPPMKTTFFDKKHLQVVP